MKLTSKVEAGELPGYGGIFIPAAGETFETDDDTAARMIAAGLAIPNKKAEKAEKKEK
jgi:hypothetical protein